MDTVSALMELSKRLSSELDNFIVKDTFTKGKNCGLRLALVTINDMVSDIERSVINTPRSSMSISAVRPLLHEGDKVIITDPKSEIHSDVGIKQ